MSEYEEISDLECPACYAPLFEEEADDPMEDNLFRCHRCGWLGYEYEC